MLSKKTIPEKRYNLLLTTSEEEILSQKTIPEKQYNCQRLCFNQTTQSRTKDAQKLFSKGQKTHTQKK